MKEKNKKQKRLIKKKKNDKSYKKKKNDKRGSESGRGQLDGSTRSRSKWPPSDSRVSLLKDKIYIILGNFQVIFKNVFFRNI